jgi:hypothetical protein
MATTDAKTGFRLPWSGDRTETGEPAEPTTDDAPVSDVATTDQEIETPPMIDAVPAAPDPVAAAEPAAAEPAPVAPAAPTPARKPNKFMADLTKAMQAAAESAREDTLQRFSAEAKTHIEAIHASSATEATELRKKADDDVASIREWSKQEIARIREETDERIAHRKTRLETEIESHAGEIEARIERVQGRVSQFEAEMASFFERLLAEDDPTRFASMAESLPEPPQFDLDPVTATVATPEAEAPAPVEVVAEPEPVAEAVTEAEPVAEAVAEPVAEAEAPVETPTAADWPAADDLTGTPAPATDADLFNIGNDDAPTEVASDDPRISALGLSPDFAAAEAEAASFDNTDTEAGADEEIPVIADDALAARLAGLVPEGGEDGAATDRATTRVVVLGLVSVASIAGFKRQLGKVAGVHSVGVSSGPDGEFVFAVTHDPSVALRDAVATLPGFGARVTGESEDALQVTARDPESEG